MMNPEIVKNMSTPKKPASSTPVISQWKRTTATTARARNPSSSASRVLLILEVGVFDMARAGQGCGRGNG